MSGNEVRIETVKTNKHLYSKKKKNFEYHTLCEIIIEAFYVINTEKRHGEIFVISKVRHIKNKRICKTTEQIRYTYACLQLT